MSASVPPLLFGGAVVGMVVLTMAVPEPSFAEGWLRAVGLPPVLLGVKLHAEAWKSFRDRSTPVRADGEPRALVTGGPYARTRNPMYLAGIVILLGLTLLLGSWISLLVSAIYAVATHLLVLPPEERALEGRFGAEYRAYRSTVPTWIRVP